jgi:hypothetical protein
MQRGLLLAFLALPYCAAAFEYDRNNRQGRGLLSEQEGRRSATRDLGATDVSLDSLADPPRGKYIQVASSTDLNLALESPKPQDKYIQIAAGTPVIEFLVVTIKGTSLTVDCQGAAVDLRQYRGIAGLHDAFTYSWYNCVLLFSLPHTFTCCEQGPASLVHSMVNCHVVVPCEVRSAAHPPFPALDCNSAWLYRCLCTRTHITTSCNMRVICFVTCLHKPEAEHDATRMAVRASRGT